MRYLGGKSRLAKEIAAIVAPRGYWWEPFCGGLSVSVQLAKYGPGLVSDANPALIALYQAVRDGWDPPDSISEEEWRNAKRLDDDNPLKAFAGFGCSFGGGWFHAFSRGHHKKPNWNPARQTRAALLRDLPAISACELSAMSFFEACPHTAPAPECVFADPPYAGTERYRGAPAFDHDRFWSFCQAWADRGTRVFVTEFSCPVPAHVEMERRRPETSGQQKRQASEGRVERLFRVLPPEPKLISIPDNDNGRKAGEEAA